MMFLTSTGKNHNHIISLLITDAAKKQGACKKMQKELKKLKNHLKICKVIILLLLFVFIFPKFAEMEEKNVKTLEFDKTLIEEAKKIHDFNKIGLNYVYYFEI